MNREQLRNSPVIWTQTAWHQTLRAYLLQEALEQRHPFSVLGRNFPLPLSPCVCVLSCFSCAWLFVTLWTVARQAPLSMGFPRQEYRSGLPCPPPDLPHPGTEPMSPASPALAGRISTTSATWEAPLSCCQPFHFHFPPIDWTSGSITSLSPYHVWEKQPWFNMDWINLQGESVNKSPWDLAAGQGVEKGGQVTFLPFHIYFQASLIAQLVKNLSAMQETWFDPWVGKICWRRDTPPTPVSLGFPCDSAGKNPPAMWKTLVWSLGWEDALEKGKASHSSILAWRIPWTV